MNSKDEFNPNLIRKDLYAKLYAYNQIFPVGEVDDIDNNISIFDDEWGLFLADKVEKRAEMKIIKTKGTHQ